MDETFFGSSVDKCIACNNSNFDLWVQKSGPDGNIFNICRCSSCGSGFLNPRPASEYLKRIYQFSGHGSSRPLSVDEILDREREYPNSTVDGRRMIFKAIELRGKRITNRALDIGSGYGFYSMQLLDTDFKVTAVNPGKWENDVFEELNGFRPIEEYIEELILEEKYDLIIMSQVLEHIDNVQGILLKIKSWLACGGIVIIAVPNINSIMVKLLGVKENGCLWVPEHLNYFSKRGLFRLLKLAGYTILDYQQISRFPYNFLSKRLLLNGMVRKICNGAVKIIQKVPVPIVNRVGCGFYHNVWVKGNDR